MHTDDSHVKTSACDDCKAEQHLLMCQVQRQLKRWCVYHRTPYYGECLLCMTSDIRSLLHDIFEQLVISGQGGVLTSSTSTEPVLPDPEVTPEGS